MAMTAASKRSTAALLALCLSACEQPIQNAVDAAAANLKAKLTAFPHATVAWGTAEVLDYECDMPDWLSTEPGLTERRWKLTSGWTLRDVNVELSDVIIGELDGRILIGSPVWGEFGPGHLVLMPWAGSNEIQCGGLVVTDPLVFVEDGSVDGIGNEDAADAWRHSVREHGLEPLSNIDLSCSTTPGASDECVDPSE